MPIDTKGPHTEREKSNFLQHLTAQRTRHNWTRQTSGRLQKAYLVISSKMQIVKFALFVLRLIHQP